MLRHSTPLLAFALLTIVVATVSASSASKPLPIDDDASNIKPRLFSDHVEITPRVDETEVNFRLPNNTNPLRYDVHLTTNVHMADFKFTGTVDITLEAVGAAVRTITLHHRSLQILSSKLVAKSAPTIAIGLNEPVYTETNNFLVYTLATGAADLVAGQQYILTIGFAGILREDDAGFYRSSYLNKDGIRKWLATTQFESTDARHAFPCFDEPAKRAVFSIKITHGRGYHAISNMPVLGDVAVSGEIATTTFVDTPLTPSYLIAFIVSDFASLTKQNGRGFVQRVFARPTGIEDGQLGLDDGIRILDAFEKYLGIPFALPKMDQVAVPDFAAGAMENWGLVTYREPYLLYSSARSTFVNLRNVVTVIAHEYAHQWFGNLVTPKWWTFLWLNEGFADLFENVATDWVYPEWKIMDSIVPDNVHSVMVYDATNRTRPMTHYVENNRSISNLFDNVAYPKSGSVLRMFMNTFTEDTFKKALNAYLTAKSNSNATEDDLFAAFETAAKSDGTLAASLSAPTIMSSWTRQPGFPLLTVERDYASNGIQLSQERYFGEPQTTITPTTWWIPYNFATARSADFSRTAADHWMGTASGTANVTDLQAGDWLLLNKRQTGYYRIKYDAKNYELLSAALLKNHTDIHLVSRAQLLDDAFELARTSRLSYADALTLAKYLVEETEYVPWAAFIRALNLVDRLQSGSTKFAKFEQFVQKLLAKLYATVGVQVVANEHHYRKQARIWAINWSCQYGNANCLAETAEQFGHYLAGHMTIHQDHRASVLCNGARNATDAQLEQLLDLLQAETDQDQRTRLVDALACAGQTKQLRSYLETSLGIEHRWASAAERYRVFVQVVSKRAGFSEAVEFLQTNFDDANELYGRANLNAAFDRVAERVNSEERKTKFEDLLTAAALTTYVDESTLVRARQTVAANYNWIAVNQNVIEEWIEKNGASTYVVSSVLMMVLVVVSQLF